MSPIVTFERQQEIKSISQNNQRKYNPIAIDVEESELIDLLGYEMLQDLQKNPSTTENQRILKPHTYENSFGRNVTHKGLEFVIAYFNYAYYASTSYINDTYNGFIEQNIQESNKISEGSLKRLINLNREIGLKAWILIKDFILLNLNDYPLFLCQNRDETRIFTPRITGVSKTKYINKKYRRVYSSNGRKRVI